MGKALETSEKQFFRVSGIESKRLEIWREVKLFAGEIACVLAILSNIQSTVCESVKTPIIISVVGVLFFWNP